MNFFPFFPSFYNMVQTHKKTQRGTLKPSILMGKDALSGVIPNLEVNATNELSNHDHEIEEILPIALDVIILEAPPSSNCKEGFEWVKKDLKWSCKNARNHTLQSGY